MVILKKHNNRIQSIIFEIDEVLSQSSTESYCKNIEETLKKSQQILQETLDYLSEDLDNSSNLQLPSIDTDLAAEDTTDFQIKEHLIEKFFAPINQYIQEEFTIFKKQRQALQEEIRGLEKQIEENYSLAQQYAKQEQIIFEFSQVLLGQIQEVLVEHLFCLATQYLSPAEGGLSSKQYISLQTMKDMETSEVIKIFEDKLEETSKSNYPFIDDLNSYNSDQKKQSQENNTEANMNAQNHQNEKLFPQIDKSNQPIDKLALPYPGYEFFGNVDMESKTTETEKKKHQLERLNNQEFSLDYQSQINEKQNLETIKSHQYLNETYAELKPPIFDDNDIENQNYENQSLTIKDEVLITPKLKLGASENIENLDNPEVLESLSNLFGKLEVDKESTNKLITTTKNQRNLKNSTAQLEEDTYTQESLRQSLLPVEEPDKKPNELSLDNQTLQCLRSDLDSLEEIDGNELIDDQEQTKLQLEEYQNGDLTEDTPGFSEDSLVMTSEAELNNLEDLFISVDEQKKSRTSQQENIYGSAENTKNKITLEDFLDESTLEIDEKITETDNQEFSPLENLLQEKTNSEKKI